MENPFEGDRAASGLSKTCKLGVHSGKGGVGKTFISANIAYSLAARGRSVGLLDADIDCPNVAEFLSLRAMATKSGARLYPAEHRGVKILSTALLSPPGQSPIIIRGPIKHNMLASFLSAEWGTPDYLVIDLPPGTADVPLSAMQLSALDALILVCSPTKEAVLDTARAANMAKKLGVMILGLIENMSGDVFGSRGEETARKLGVRFLGSVPLSAETAAINERGGIAFLEQASLFPLRDSVLAAVEGASVK
ncbi:MAG: P-loop NTPase [Candidatus Micrarchaeota archaeon]